MSDIVYICNVYDVIISSLTWPVNVRLSTHQKTMTGTTNLSRNRRTFSAVRADKAPTQPSKAFLTPPTL